MSRKKKAHRITEQQVLTSLDASDAADLTPRGLCCSLNGLQNVAWSWCR